MKIFIKNCTHFFRNIIIGASLFICSLNLFALETVKIGYYPSSGFFEGAYEGGVKSGYGYEYIKMVSNYADWTYEYVYDSWPNLMDKLLRGEIDALADVSYTPERAEHLLYPKYTMGKESSYIFTSKHNLVLDSKDITTLNGATIGVSSYSTQIQDLQNFLNENNVKCRIILYDNDDKRLDDTEKGLIDATVELDITIRPELVPLYKISSSEYYMVLAKGRENLLDQLNQILSVLYTTVPTYNDELYKKYYTRILISKKLTLSERNWLEEHPRLKIGCINKNLPFSSKDNDGGLKGAILDWFQEVRKELEITNEFEYFFYDTHTQLKNALLNNEIDIAFPIYNDSPSADDTKLIYSEPLTVLNMMLAYNSDSEGDISSSIAVPEDSLYYNFAKDFYPNSLIITYKSPEQCITAVTNNLAKSALLNEYKMLSTLYHQQVSFSINTKTIPYTSEYCFAVNRENEPLIAFINRGIMVVPQSTTLMNIANVHAQDMMFNPKEFIQHHKEFIYIIVTLFVILLIAVAYIIKGIDSSIHKNEQEQQLKNQIGLMLNKEQIYKNAINSGACGYYECNITKNLITSAIYEFVKNDMTDVTNAIHLPRPIRYSDLIGVVRKERLFSNQEDFKKITSPEYLMQAYAEGNLIPVVTYWALSPTGLTRCHKQYYYLSKEAKTGDLIALVVVKDVSAEQKKEDELKRNHKIIEVLATEYQSVYYIDLKTESIIPYSNSELSKNGEKLFFETNHSYSEAYKSFVEEAVFSEDQEIMMEIGSIKNIVSKLDRQKSFTTIFRSLENENQTEPHYFEMKFIKVGDTPLPTAVILGFANKDSEIRMEQERRLQLDAARKKAEIASEAKSKFLFNMSHDIRTPMNAIIGFTDMAKKYKSDDTKLDECLSKISMASEHLLSLINDVLDMSRIESGKLSIEEEAGNLIQTQKEMVEIINRTAIDNHISLEYDFTQVRDEEVYFDKLHLNQIVLNVLSNAIKYTKENGHVKYTIIQDESIDENTAVYQFIIEDNGIGMSKEFLKHVFEAFERERSSTVSRIQGTGLGLSITKSLVDLMDGTIDIESDTGKGTKVQFWLHFRLVHEVEKKNQEKKVKGSFSLKGKRILLVEDNELNREISRDLLEDEEVIIEEAEDGSVAVEKVENAPAGYYDYVLMDVQMPYMNGYKATETIRSLPDKAKASVPIIAVTANVFEEDKEKALKSGMNSHVTKPINFNVLIDTLSKL
ncbi:MAG: transporter substrate-binding domain-containing protein [Treponema sp.]|nr:transporter substrate-binding domain-containing protein [Treponema sp.]